MRPYLLLLLFCASVLAKSLPLDPSIYDAPIQVENPWLIPGFGIPMNHCESVPDRLPETLDQVDEYRAELLEAEAEAYLSFVRERMDIVDTTKEAVRCGIGTGQNTTRPFYVLTATIPDLYAYLPPMYKIYAELFVCPGMPAAERGWWHEYSSCAAHICEEESLDEEGNVPVICKYPTLRFDLIEALRAKNAAVDWVDTHAEFVQHDTSLSVIRIAW